jgi:hypothetical protein
MQWRHIGIASLRNEDAVPTRKSNQGGEVHSGGDNPMAVSDHVNFADFMAEVKRRKPHQDEFVQAVQEGRRWTLAFGVI